MRVDSAQSSSAHVHDRVSSPQLAEGQRLLNRYNGWARVPESGEMTRETREALEEFQREQGLPRSGRFDAETTMALQRAVTGMEEERAETEWPLGDGSAHVRARGDGGARRGSTQESLAAERARGRLAERQQGSAGQRADAKRSVDADKEASGDGANAREARRVGDLQPREASWYERAGLRALMGTFPQLRAAQAAAERYGKTVVVGMGADAGVPIVGGSASSGVYFGPEGEVGFTGSATFGGAVQAAPGASLQAEVTVLDGGPELLQGEFSVAGGTVSAMFGEVGAQAVFDAEGKYIGWTGQLGPGTDPLDAQAVLQEGWGTATQPLIVE